ASYGHPSSRHCAAAARQSPASSVAYGSWGIGGGSQWRSARRRQRASWARVESAGKARASGSAGSVAAATPSGSRASHATTACANETQHDERDDARRHRRALRRERRRRRLGRLVPAALVEQRARAECEQVRAEELEAVLAAELDPGRHLDVRVGVTAAADEAHRAEDVDAACLLVETGLERPDERVLELRPAVRLRLVQPDRRERVDGGRLVADPLGELEG